MRSRTCVFVVWFCGVATSASAGDCFIGPESPLTEVKLQVSVADTRPVTVTEPQPFTRCEDVRVVSGAGVAIFTGKDCEQEARKRIAADSSLDPKDFCADNAAVKAVDRTILAVLKDAPETRAPGQKYFDKPQQIGAPFGDVYIPPRGLPVRIFGVEPTARVQFSASDGGARILEVSAEQRIVLDRKRFRAGELYDVRVIAASSAPPAGAFEVIDQGLADQIDRALQAIDQDELLNAETRVIARALLFQLNGLSFNRESALKELKK